EILRIARDPDPPRAQVRHREEAVALRGWPGPCRRAVLDGVGHDRARALHDAGPLPRHEHARLVQARGPEQGDRRIQQVPARPHARRARGAPRQARVSRRERVQFRRPRRVELAHAGDDVRASVGQASAHRGLAQALHRAPGTEEGEMTVSRRGVLRAAAAGALLAAAPALAQRAKGPRVWLDMDQAELDDAYDQSVYAPNQKQVTGRYVTNSDAVRARLGAPKRFAYGSTPVEALDVWATKRPTAPINVFVHGGA